VIDRINLPTAREMIPTLLHVLERLDREADVPELEELVARELGLTTDQLAHRHDVSRSEFQYRFAWTRSYAKKQGAVVSPKRNRWSLAPSSPSTVQPE
jgi:restriction system protein